MENHKYSLSKKGKSICPKCGHKTFVLYIDNNTGQPVHETVGRCDRENNCAHHYTPKQYFTDNNINFDRKPTICTPITKPQPAPSFIDMDILKKTLTGYEKNELVKFLCGVFGVEVTKKVIERYFVGTSKNGGAIFWQVDLLNKVRTGKVIQYDESGHRRKDVTLPVQWVHSLLKIPSFHLSQCLFGEHLLRDTTKKVAIVESEKTAIIASVYLPNMIWLATGGSNGINIDKCQCLKGRNVILYPDAGMFDKWNEKAKELSKLCIISVSTLVEQHAADTDKKAGYDIADYLLQNPYKDEIKQETQTPQQVKECATTKEIKQNRQGNDEVLHFKTETVNFDNDINELAGFFSTITLPETPIKLNAWTTINDARYFVESSLTCLRAHHTNAAYLPYLEQLQEFKNHLLI